MPPPDALGSFSRRQAQIICENLATCCQEHGYKHDVSGCRATLAGELALRETVAKVGAVVNESAIDACLVAAKDYALSCVAPDETARAYVDACTRVVSGPQAQGEACTHDLACAQPKGGPGHARCYSGICVLELPPAENVVCSPQPPSYSNCDASAELYCSVTTGRCLKRTPPGATCLDTKGCQAGGYCRQGTCVAQAAIGQDCGGYVDGCIEPGACNPTTKACEAKRSLGESCNQPSECGSGHCDATCQPAGLVAGSARCSG